MAPSGICLNVLISLVLLLTLSRGVFSASPPSLLSKVVLVDNGYEGVVVALDESLPQAECQEIVKGLEVSCLVVECDL